ncbi:hypothetical protein JHK87_022631 [Glycine soja]|nr:hypothetical protein JHK87_022631 [Glycine soja]
MRGVAIIHGIVGLMGMQFTLYALIDCVMGAFVSLGASNMSLQFIMVYANDRAEEIMGQAIQELDWKHSDIIISTSCNDKGLSCKHIIEGTKASLKRLDMEYNMWMFSTVTGRIPLCRYGIRRIQF